MNTVDSVLNRNLRAEAEKRGYIVVAPAAPDGELFFEEGARVFPEFLQMILAEHKIQDNKFHIAGPSNGGIAAFHVAAANPQYFLSVGVPRIHVGTQRRKAAGDLENVRFHVCRRA
jgi:poly(3-hydroxybutyrate) depolymerase